MRPHNLRWGLPVHLRLSTGRQYLTVCTACFSVKCVLQEGHLASEHRGHVQLQQRWGRFWKCQRREGRWRGAARWGQSKCCSFLLRPGVCEQWPDCEPDPPATCFCSALQAKDGSHIFKGCQKCQRRLEYATETVCDPAKPQIFPI